MTIIRPQTILLIIKIRINNVICNNTIWWKQYKVKAGEILKIEKLEESKPESKIEFKEILAYGDDKTIEVGAPLVEKAKVEAILIENGKNRTVLIFKKRRRKNSRRKNGHRQTYSLIKN